MEKSKLIALSVVSIFALATLISTINFDNNLFKDDIQTIHLEDSDVEKFISKIQETYFSKPTSTATLFSSEENNNNLSTYKHLPEEKPYINGSYFYKNKTPFIIKGVNIGAGKASYFPGEHGIGYNEYYDWFEKIHAMNANTVRVYTIHPPAFYEALNNFNTTVKNPIYLIHGIWLDEHFLETYNALDYDLKEGFKYNIRNTSDLIHGNLILPKRKGYAHGTYTSDVSKYIIGYIIGIEWDAEFVKDTNEKNKGLQDFSGEHLYTKNAQPFEIMMAEMGDYLISNDNKYNNQIPIAFSNWVTTDTVDQTNEPFPNENLVAFNVNNIYHDRFNAGIFASYHVYPYYPDGLVYTKRYAEYKHQGQINTYRAYLEELITNYKIPVLISEFGIPASRGITHENIYTGFNQGMTDEITQGKQLVSMFNDIVETGYCGGVVFSWQDEWFKRTWNTQDYNNPNRRAYWSDIQTNEQSFGLIDFVEEKEVYLDGEIDDWHLEVPVTDNKLYIKTNHEYLYFMIKNPQENFYIAIDTLKTQGNTFSTQDELSFKNSADFLLSVHGEEGELKVASYYDQFYHDYAFNKKMIERNELFEKDNNGLFNPIQLVLHYKLYLPETDTTLPLKTHNTGKLIYGTTDPKANDYYSIADIYKKNNILEFRIPWALLNFSDPSQKEILNNFYETERYFNIDSIEIEHIDNTQHTTQSFTWDNWGVERYETKLKKSYYILQEAWGQK